MNTDSNKTIKSGSDSKSQFYVLVKVLCVLLLILLVVSLIQMKPSPPDFNHCTRLVIPYPSVKDLFSLPISFDPNFLSVADIEHLQSLDKIINDDKKSIKAFARQVSSGSYKGLFKGNVPMGKPTLSVVGYCNDERIAFVTMYGLDMIVTEDKCWFDYDRDLSVLPLLAPQDIKPLVLRMQCGGHLWFLYDESLWPYKKTNSYPSPTGWCDSIVREAGVDDYLSKSIKKLLKCPAISEGQCQYVMNPHCEPNSPPDTVLLFETKRGWNQHGGPELFTFDNHDPKGGCVLLNDGTVKFIRTKEELQQLRWK
jgi:hypothetical protein